MRLRERLILSEVESWPEAQQEAFHALREKGNSVVLAHMLASRQTPSIRTDSTFMAAQHRIKDLDDATRERLCRKLARNGVTVNPQGTYHRGMARFEGDPEAYFDHGEAIGKIQSVAKKRGIKVEGLVEVDGRRKDAPPIPDKVYDLHPRIVERKRLEKIQENPDLARMDQDELRHQIIQKHAPKTKISGE